MRLMRKLLNVNTKLGKSLSLTIVHNLAAVWGNCKLFLGGEFPTPTQKMPGINTVFSDTHNNTKPSSQQL